MIGPKRRESVFKCFAAFISVCDIDINSHLLELMLEPLNRTISEIEHKEEISKNKGNKRLMSSDNITSTSATALPKDVIQLLEDTCGTELFMNALATVKSKARDKREARKRNFATEAIHDPEAAARRKVVKHEKENKRKKRRIEEKKANRGVFGKKPRHIV